MRGADVRGVRRLRGASWLFALVLGAALVLTSACGGGGEHAEVIATTAPIAALTRAVAGEGVSVHALIGAGVDAHDYEPSAADVKRIADARLVPGAPASSRAHAL